MNEYKLIALILAGLLAMIVLVVPLIPSAVGNYPELEDGQSLHYVDNRIIEKRDGIYVIYLDSSDGLVQFTTNLFGAKHIAVIDPLWVIKTASDDPNVDRHELYDLYRCEPAEFECVPLDYYDRRRR